jgi:TolB-like protein
VSDVFLSYNREDQTIAQRFAQGFEREGLSVWWMPTLRSGETYDSATEKALRQAASVAVLWSRRSVESQWVRAEATIASRSGKLVPAMVEPCDRPVAFELTQTADLTHWKGDAGDPVWRAYVADVRGVVERNKQLSAENRSERMDSSPTATQPAFTAKSRTRMGVLPLVLIVLAVPLVVAAVWMLRRVSSDPSEPARAAASTPVPSATAQPVAPTASVAVMPFANLTGETEKEYFSDGMAEELINALAKVPGLKVASRTSSFAYKGKNSDVRQIARDLNVATVLEGSVRSAGARVRVTAQLVNAASGYHVWSRTYDHEFKDLFKLQDELATEIVAEFKKSQDADLPSFVSEGPPTRDLEAYALYLRAQIATAGSSETQLAEAYDLASQAIARDPGFGRAYLVRSTINSLRSRPTAEVERDLRKALELDPANAAAAKGGLASLEARRGNWVAAEELFAAIDGSANPDFHQTHAIGTLWTAGHLRKAMEELSEARRLAPAALGFNINLGRAYSALGDDAQAIRYTNIAIAMGADLKSRRTQQPFVDAATRAGRYTEAADRIISTLPEGTDQRTIDMVRLVHTAMANETQRKAAIAAINALVPTWHERDWFMLVSAMAWYTQLDALDGAYDSARRLQAILAPEGVVNTWAWLWNPELRAFRQDKRFQPFVTSLGLMKYWERYGPPDDCELKDGKLTCH